MPALPCLRFAQRRHEPRHPLQRPAVRCRAPARPSSAQPRSPALFVLGGSSPRYRWQDHRFHGYPPVHAIPHAAPPRGCHRWCTAGWEGNRRPSRCRPDQALPSSCRRHTGHRHGLGGLGALACHAPGPKTGGSRPTFVASVHDWPAPPAACHPHECPGSGCRTAQKMCRRCGWCKTRAPRRAPATEGTASLAARAALGARVRGRFASARA